MTKNKNKSEKKRQLFTRIIAIFLASIMILSCFSMFT